MFSERLKAIRKQKGFTQLKLAEKSGIAQSNISFYEKGKFIPTIYSIECLCVALGVTATELLGF